MFLMVRVFIFKRHLGFGIGDLFYIIPLAFYFIIQLTVQLAIKNKWVKLFFSLINIYLAVYILLKIYVYYGPEVSYEWKHGIWKW